MKFVDTNIFVRYLAGDDPAKQVRSSQLFEKVRKGDEQVITTEGVIHETCYVLTSSNLYNLSHTDVRDRLYPLLELDDVLIRDKPLYLQALNLFGDHGFLDYIDAVAIAHTQSGISDGIYSYDRKISKIDGANRTEP